MAVDDHGLETLKKAAEQVTPGDKSDLYHKVGIVFDDSGTITPVSSDNPLPVTGTTGGGGSGAASSFSTGAQSSITTSAVQMVASSTPASVGLTIRADRANTGIVFVGNSSGVTAGTDDSTDGMPLSPGEVLNIELNNANKVYLIASASTQKVYWVAV